MLHEFFAEARLDLQFKDRFGFEVQSREWFLIPLEAIEEGVEKLIAKMLTQYRYDVETAKLVKC